MTYMHVAQQPHDSLDVQVCNIKNYMPCIVFSLSANARLIIAKRPPRRYCHLVMNHDAIQYNLLLWKPM